MEAAKNINKFVSIEAASKEDSEETLKVAHVLSTAMSERGYLVVVFDFPEQLQPDTPQRRSDETDLECFHSVLSRFYRLQAKLQQLRQNTHYSKPLFIISLFHVYR